MTRATFHGTEPRRDDGLRQIEPVRLSPADSERIKRDIEKHREKCNRLDAERAGQRALYAGGAA